MSNDNKAQRSLSQGCRVLAKKKHERKMCANPSCNTFGVNLKQCARCKSVWYCDKTCQMAGWELHKRHCAKLKRLPVLNGYNCQPGGECAICLEPLGDPMKLERLPCGHEYHTQCIKKVFEHSIPSNDPGKREMTMVGGSMFIRSGPAKDEVKCPLCRQESTFGPDTELSAISLFFAKMESCSDKKDKFEQAKVLEPMVQHLLDSKPGEQRQLLLSMLGDIQIETHSLNDAIASYTEALLIDTSKIQAKNAVPLTHVHNNLGWALEQKGDLGSAVKSFRKAIATDTGPKTNLRAYLNLGCKLGDIGNHTEAATTLQECLRRTQALRKQYLSEPVVFNGLDQLMTFENRYPTCPSYLEIGYALSGVGQTADATESWRSALAVDPLDAKAHYNIGTQYCDGKDFDAAMEAYTTSRDIDPLFAHAHARLGFVFYMKWQANQAGGDHCTSNEDPLLEIARTSIEQAIVIDPLCADFHFYLGHVLGAKHEYTAALSSFKGAVAINKKRLEQAGWLESALQGVRHSLQHIVRDKKQMECQHVLERFWTTDGDSRIDRYSCSKCKKRKFAAGTRMHSCNQGCGWGVCSECFEEASLSTNLVKGPDPELHLSRGRHQARRACGCRSTEQGP
jgi:tetratricopeptide (TPR) repeat protein